METLSLFLFLPALVIGLFAVLFGLSRVASLDGISHIGSNMRSWQFNLWHMMAAVVVAALLLAAINADPGAGRVLPFFLVSVWALAWFLRTWCGEFVFLMGLRDEDFPGRNDKLIWVFLLFVFAPISVWVFRSYRAAYWPEPKTMVEPEPAASRSAAQPV